MFKIECKTIYENCLASDVYDEYYPDIVDYFDTVNTVYGDIKITVNASQYGDIYYITDEMDYGDTCLCVWLQKLLEACIVLHSGTEYRIREIECEDVFLCFEKNENADLSVTYLCRGKTEWTETISYKEFFDEVICKAQKFIDDLCGYNGRMAYSPVVSRIKAKLAELKKEIC